MFTGEITVGQCFFHVVLHLLGGLFQLHGAQFLHHSLGFLSSSLLALLSVDRLKPLGYQLYLGTRRYRENIAVEMDGTPLVLGFGEHFSHSLQHTKALVSNHQLDPVQATATQPLEEADPAGLILFHALGSAQNLAVAVLIDRNRHHNGYIFKLSSPVAAQIDPIHIDIRISSALQRAVAPILNVDICLLVQFTNGRGRYLAAPKSFRNVLYSADGYSSQVHLDEGLLHTALSAAVPLDNSSFKGYPLELGHLECDIPRSSSKITAIVTAPGSPGAARYARIELPGLTSPLQPPVTR